MLLIHCHHAVGLSAGCRSQVQGCRSVGLPALLPDVAAAVGSSGAAAVSGQASGAGPHTRLAAGHPTCNVLLVLVALEAQGGGTPALESCPGIAHVQVCWEGGWP